MKKVALSFTQAFAAKNISLEASEAEMLKNLEAEINVAFQQLQDGTISKEDAEKAISEAIKKNKISAGYIYVPGTAKKNEDGTNDGDDLTLDQFLRERSKEINDLKKSTTPEAPRSYNAALKEAVKSLSAKVKAHKANSNGNQTAFSIEEVIKAPEMIDTGNVIASVGAIPVTFDYRTGAPNPDVRITPSIMTLLDNGNTSVPALAYADKLPTQGTMAIVPEGTLKPLISFSFERRFSMAFKIAGRTKVTEEALDDFPGLEATINGELRYAHDIAEENAVYAHINSFAPGFVAGALAATTTAPNQYDAIRASIYAIKIVSKGRFIPNAAVINSADAYAMGATKDTTNNYLLPPFVLPNGTMISGVRIIEVQDDVNVPPGTFIVGDFRKIKRRVYKPFSLRMGQFGITSDGTTVASIMSDFECNLYTFIGESRQHLYHYKNDETAFIKSTFAAVMTAIEAPAAP